jgi:hypothetical protein
VVVQAVSTASLAAPAPLQLSARDVPAEVASAAAGWLWGEPEVAAARAGALQGSLPGEPVSPDRDGSEESTLQSLAALPYNRHTGLLPCVSYASRGDLWLLAHVFVVAADDGGEGGVGGRALGRALPLAAATRTLYLPLSDGAVGAAVRGGVGGVLPRPADDAETGLLLTILEANWTLRGRPSAGMVAAGGADVAHTLTLVGGAVDGPQLRLRPGALRPGYVYTATASLGVRAVYTASVPVA